MNGKSLFQRCCVDAGIDFEQTFFFQTSQVALHLGKRISQAYISCQINNIDYIVRYYPDNDIYFVWNHIRGRNSCSFSVPPDYSVISGNIRKDYKRIGDGRKNTEPVYSFSSIDVKRFLEENVLV